MSFEGRVVWDAVLANGGRKYPRLVDQQGQNYGIYMLGLGKARWDT